MHIKKEMKLADVIQLNYMLIPVIHRFGINLGFGDKTVAAVCEENEVDLNFFLQLVNAYHDKDYFPKEELQSIPSKDIVTYLKMTHSSYLNEKLSEIEDLIEALQHTETEDEKYILLIRNFYEGYKNELTEHIMHEEEVVFPYVLTVEEICKAGVISEKNQKIYDSFSILKYQDAHDDVEEKLMDLKTIMIKYLTPPLNTNLYHKIIQDLFKLEEDLNYHSRIEDKVLTPKVILMEKSIKNLL
ncbi:hemerythrin domain-containing protein [Labilibaculum sp. DW002]|uniref:Hemerythrin domain-containing protein n=1 Tax=Paralabilibaculum antarcticum TaxID=2912572 RepID=A0ABT5VY70_9BACT|nr:hemerythrin domain-containing protein [Labilibaculum sp. DW002]MDE5420353.1 hemerythrin domain-containing protein [Labilibaculum sp. DW002]